ncbi:MAG: hypothetical protein PHU14_14095, partial [Methylovulum sp.]|nr:hypothetical protein [Methylovulum sp.]
MSLPMPVTIERDRLKKFFNNLEDKPVDPTDAFYYPFLAESDDDPIAELAGRISFSQSQSVNLFTGQRGCGKSTEFRRLQAMLVADGCEVFLLDMRDYMNLTTPVEISDFLISIMVALSEVVESRYGKALHSRGYINRIVDVLKKDVKFEGVNAVGIKASLKDDPSFKQLLQQSLKGHVAGIVKDAHSL